MSEACTPFGYVRGINSVSLMLMVKIESYAIGSAVERGQARGRRLFARYEPHARYARSAQFVSGLHQNELYQLNFNNNPSGRILDLIYANWPAASTCSSIRVCENPHTTIDGHHPPLDFELD